LLLCCVLFSALAGCSSPAARRLSDSERQQAISALTRDLLALGPSADSREARTFAEAAVDEANALGIQYRAVRPSWFHNVLVNTKVKRQGLCYHWANDLSQKLVNLPIQSFELHFAVARIGTLREHNAIVVTLRGQPFAEGLVLDAWRHSGVLAWSHVVTDKYPWQPMR
jgi:hypothetical protein